MKRSLKLILASALAAATVGTVAFFALPASAEAASFTVTNSWSTGYQGEVTVSNPASSKINTWKVQLTLPAGSTIGQAWNATLATGGQTFTFTPAGWNGTIAGGSATSFGFVVTGTGRPTSCTVNGQACTGLTGAPSATATSAPGKTPTSAPATATGAPKPSATTASPTRTATAGGTPLAANGQLKVCGAGLCNQNGKKIQLRGVSSHGIHWFPGCYTGAAMDALATDWNADLFRIAMYVQEGGYESDPTGQTAKVNSLVDMAEAHGMYALIDFHVLNPGDPNLNLARAKEFFAKVAARNAAKKNVIYEIANEPNGVSWAGIKSYAEQVIPVIRANDPDGIVIIGTRGWSSLGVSEGSSSAEIIDNPVNATNIMYAFHFYAASHKDDYRAEVQKAAASIPLFVTEFGTVSASGDGAVDTAGTTAWLDLLDKLKISYANWNFGDKAEGSSILKPGSCNAGAFSGTGALTPSGQLIRSRIRTPDDF
ncbi:endoglucanase [Actinoplanes sp. SE50]|uniref:cellulase family glycosylhydrolase n=1 Tax=unclassified Actinoplanes TaxID=2626549 RepID=UPI00023ECEFC|nr:MULTISPECIES: cellulase family glycosylhydrolase [unclassified Actinoplanes]AEV86064.1 glycoside hydrolase family protein [Actinoplanes sp. SE50/110]ATO84462.1 endoglucanase [Actinoplanes sp. SE50]SLM01872.1 endoglucanase [Actinoplanes sp. SE50/110]